MNFTFLPLPFDALFPESNSSNYYSRDSALWRSLTLNSLLISSSCVPNLKGFYRESSSIEF